MKLWIFLIGIILCFGLNSCKTSIKNDNAKQLPKDLNGAMDYFIKKWNGVEITNFKNKPENDAINELHFSVGRWIRNNWILGKRDTDLVNYFNKEGAYNPDDISSIILTSLHRKLNNQPLNLKAQIGAYKAYWKPINNCEEIAKKKAITTYNRFKVNDPITILMSVDLLSDGERNAVTVVCPTVKWKFNPKKDLALQGIVSEKYTINSDSNVFFKVRITKMNFPNTKIFMDTVKIGSVVSLSLENLNVK